MAIKNLEIKSIILILLYNLISISSYSQCDYADFSDAPEELFRKRIKEPGMRYGNPYTMFVRGDDFNLEKTIQKIKDNIRFGTPIQKEKLPVYSSLYKGIYESARGGEPAKCPETGNYFDDDGATTEVCMHAAWTKNNAIVYLIGLKHLKI